MGIIINDFEILLDPPPQTSESQQGQAAEQQPTPPPPFRPQDIERIMRHFDERRSRVRAD